MGTSCSKGGDGVMDPRDAQADAPTRRPLAPGAAPAHGAAAVVAVPGGSSIPLESHELTPDGVPRRLQLMSDGLRNSGGLTSTGIFRLEATKLERQALREQLARGGPVSGTPDTFACELKCWLGELPVRLIGPAHYPACIAATNAAADDVVGAATLSVFNGLPVLNQRVLILLARLVYDITQNRSSSMTVHACAVCLTPRLLCNPSDDLMVMQRNMQREIAFVARLFTELAARERAAAALLGPSRGHSRGHSRAASLGGVALGVAAPAGSSAAAAAAAGGGGGGGGGLVVSIAHSHSHHGFEGDDDDGISGIATPTGASHDGFVPLPVIPSMSSAM